MGSHLINVFAKEFYNSHSLDCRMLSLSIATDIVCLFLILADGKVGSYVLDSVRAKGVIPIEYQRDTIKLQVQGVQEL